MIEAMIPKKHGFEVCQEIKKIPHGKMSPVIIVTAVYTGRKYRTQALHHYGCDAYLEKPIPDDTLIETVTRLVKSAGAAAQAEAAEPAAEPPAAAEPVAAQAAEADDVELEIMERLDELIPDDKSGQTSSSVDQNVVSFDPRRQRPSLESLYTVDHQAPGL